MQYPRIMISAPKSGSGKTLLTIALMQALKTRGRQVAAFKCGPDYIDPLFHKKVLGIPSKNLDLFFTDPDTTRALFQWNHKGDISVIEGVMGLYDGLGGIKEEASSYHLAQTLQCPVILVVDARGMARSLLAEIRGFLSMDHAHLIRGLILNNMSGMIYSDIKTMIEEDTNVSVLGYFPVQKELQLESRYLGLKLPEEVVALEEKAKQAAKALEETVDLDAILQLAEEADDLPYQTRCLKPAGLEAVLTSASQDSEKKQEKIRIAVARDAAFCFYYEDNLRMLEAMGAELVEFSPLADSRLPEGICGILMGGGYPELFAEKLSENQTMKEAIKDLAKKGMPIVAECGGFMYLHQNIETAEGQNFPMVGLIDGDISYKGKLVRFGYITLTEKEEIWCDQIKAHEFHYYDSSSNGEACHAAKPVGKRNWKCVHASESQWMGFPHLYYPSNPAFPAHFVEQCRQYKTK